MSSEVKTISDKLFHHGIGHKFPEDWTDEQVQEWNIANCMCPFHASQREKEK